MKILAFDIGGTFIKYCIAKKDKGNIVFLTKSKFRNDTTNLMSGEQVITNMSTFAAKMVKQDPEIKYVCSTIGGVIDTKHGKILSAHHRYKDYKGLDVISIFRKHCQLPFYIINDVKAAALGELKYGCLKNIPNVNAIVMTIGTGIAGCPIINGQLYVGNSYASGESAALRVNGHRFENHYAVPPLIARCRQVDPKLQTGEECLKLAKTNYMIRNIIDRWYMGIADAIDTYTLLFNPGYFVFGGGITEDKNFDVKKLRRILLKNTRQPPFNSIEEVKIVKAKLGNDAALYGAISLVE